MTTFSTSEKDLSQDPALQLLIRLGYNYLSPEKALDKRGGKRANVLLEDVLYKQLNKLNRIHHKGKKHHFSEANVQEAIRKLKHVQYDGLKKTNEAVYDLLTLGATLEQSVEGDLRSFPLHYIDWKNRNNNVFHVVPEYSVERTNSAETVRPDIVLFVNGIPLGVIECKAPSEEIEQGISQTIRNQGDEYIPKLFCYMQLVMAVKANAASYATVGTGLEHWSVWQEMEDEEETVAEWVNAPLTDEQKTALSAGEFAQAAEPQEERLPTEQDKAICSLCRPERLLELMYLFTLFDEGVKKIAHYQQFFVVRSTLRRIKSRDAKGNREGGIIWHAQGSGKSLTMVMLARAIALETDLRRARILLVTDRDDLDKQLGNTFAACQLSKERATSGRNLIQHLKDKVGIVTTLIHKFDTALNAELFVDESADLFVLVDESHRTNYNTLAARMRQMLPNACFLGFTGTPLMRDEKRNTLKKFGSLIAPHYPLAQAVKDEAVLPLLYEGRHVEMEQDEAAVDKWFERHTAGLTKEQKADLKKKYSNAGALNKAEQVIYMQAFDISEHYRQRLQRTGFKAQLVAPSKAAAIQYHKCLKEIGHVTSEVIISAPDTREGHEEVNEGPTGVVGQFWERMMVRYRSEAEYNKQIIHQFKSAGDPEILIVVDKLLTGFDAPRNTVLYLCRSLKDHTLLQAIARVNRLYKDKEFGYIVDYVSASGEVDSALSMYDSLLEDFDRQDLEATLTDVAEEVQKLPQRLSDLEGVFKSVQNKNDMEAIERALADEELRKEFYERLSQYGKTLGIALSTVEFFTETEDAKIREYKSEFNRFDKLKKSVQIRYAEVVDYSEYEPKIQKLLDTHIRADDVIQLNEPVDIFDRPSFDVVRDGSGTYESKSTEARADAIAYDTKRVINERMEEDPAFYQKFSKLIQKAIEDFKAERLGPGEYLERATELREQVDSQKRDDVPDSIKDNPEASAYYGVIHLLLKDGMDESDSETLAAEVAEKIKEILKKNWKIDFWRDQSAQQAVRNSIDDVLYDDLPDDPLTTSQKDEIIEKTMQIAKNWRR